jgi:NAD+ synthetase
MKIALAQINTIIGDFEYNLAKILKNIEQASTQGADLIVFPELAICGYPPKDLLLRRQFIEDSKKYLNLLAGKCKGRISVIVGFPEENPHTGKPLFDSVALIHAGKVIFTRQKCLLPTYDVFDEDRYFEPAKEIKPVGFLEKKIGLTVCEDIWHSQLAWTKPRYHVDPIDELSRKGIDFIINSSASPYYMGKPKLRESVIKDCASKHKKPIIYVNQVGGNDEIIFDGNSCAVNASGEVVLKLKSFQEDLKFIELETISHLKPVQDMEMIPEEELFEAIKCGLGDYMSKCGFKKAIIGLSGGIDSAVVAVLAAYALGKENVTAVFMPSRYTVDESSAGAKKLVENLGINFITLSIEEPFKVFLNLLLPLWGKDQSMLAQENIQPRIRGLILMALSNQSGALVLSTGNKSELATGYCTLYGDMCGGLSLISDLPKTVVYRLAKYLNRREGKELIPENIIKRPPTAELRPNQTDQDTLPPYDVLDHILNLYVEEHLPLNEIVKNNLPKDTVLKVCNMINKSEYKRQQAAPGLKLTSRSFGYGWRMPIAQRYKEEI